MSEFRLRVLEPYYDETEEGFVGMRENASAYPTAIAWESSS